MYLKLIQIFVTSQLRSHSGNCGCTSGIEWGWKQSFAGKGEDGYTLCPRAGL